jgi:surface protein
MKKIMIIITTLIVASLSPTYATAAPQLNIPLNFKYINIAPLAVFDCFDVANVGQIGTAGECLGLMIVDDTTIRQAVDNNDDLTIIFTGQVTDISYMFFHTDFNQDISSWNTSNIIFFSSMFEGNLAFNQDLSNWNTSSNYDNLGMFDGSLMESFPEKQPIF